MAEKLQIPNSIRVNTLKLAATQCLFNLSYVLVPSMAGLIMLRLTGSLAMVGLVESITGLGRIAIAYPTGKVMDAFGRRIAIVMGMLLGAAGSMAIYASLTRGALSAFIVGLALIGLSVGSVMQTRTAAADMYPPARRAQGISYVMTVGLAGALATPVMVAGTSARSSALGTDPYVLPWLLAPIPYLAAALVTLWIRPDPRYIGSNLPRYYPNLPDEPARSGASDPPPRTLGQLTRYYPIVASVLGLSFTWGTMSWGMALGSVLLSHAGSDLAAITFSVALHTVGMFGLMIPIGWAVDRYGRKWGLIGGLASSACGAILTASIRDYWVITTGLFLVGTGWSAAVVATTALISDVTRPLERGRAMGLADMVAAAFIMGFPPLGGMIAQTLSFPVFGIISASSSLIPITMAFIVKEPRVGVYAHASAPR